MKKIALLLLCLSAIVWGRTWDSFTMMGNNDYYVFGPDSLVHLETSENLSGVYIYSYRNCYGGLKHDLDYGVYVIDRLLAFKSIPFDNVTKDSIWLPRKDFGERASDTAKFLNGDFSKDDFEYYDISKDTLLKIVTSASYNRFLDAFDSSLNHFWVNLFVYQKYNGYRGLCYRFFRLFSEGSAFYCRYQDDDSWNFEGGVHFEWALWNDEGLYCDDDYVDVCYDERDHPYYCHLGIKRNSLIYRPLRKDKSSPYKVNGTPASKNSSNIVIRNKKQPTLMLKGNR